MSNNSSNSDNNNENDNDIEYVIDVFIEIAKNGHIKYEYDKERKALICDRVLHTPLKYHFNYGFVPNTLSEDGDPIDVVVLMDDELIPGSYIQCKIIGVLETSDDKGDDPKLIAFPSKKVAPGYELFENINDLSIISRGKIKYFFQHYKDLENKKVNIGEFKGRKQAIQIYEESVKRANPIRQSNNITNYYSKTVYNDYNI
jgi:inorganic pyrophosphatase